MTTMFAASPGAGRRSRKWRPFGSRRRKHQGRRGMKRNIPNTPMKMTVHKSRSRTNDTESIQRMIANLPAKRSTRRAIQFKDDDIKTRSQATIHSVTFASSFTRPSLKSRKERDRTPAKSQLPAATSDIQPAGKKKRKHFLIQSKKPVAAVQAAKKPASKLIQSSLNFPKRRHFPSKQVTETSKDVIGDTLNRVTRKSTENLISAPIVQKKRMGRPPKRQSLPTAGQATLPGTLLSKVRSSSANSVQVTITPMKTLRARSKPAELPSPSTKDSGENTVKEEEVSVEKLEKSETSQILAEMRKAMLVNEIRLMSQQQNLSKTKSVTSKKRKIPAPGRLGATLQNKKQKLGSVNSHKISSFFPKIVPQTRQRLGLNSTAPTNLVSQTLSVTSPAKPCPSIVETTAKLKQRLEEKRKSLSLSTLPTDIPSEVLHSVLEDNSKKVSARRVKSKKPDKPVEVQVPVPSTSKVIALKSTRTKPSPKPASTSVKRTKAVAEDAEERYLRIKGYVPPEELSKEPIMCPGCGLEFHNHAACERHRRKCSYTQPPSKPSESPQSDIVEPSKKFSCTVCDTEFNNHGACNRHEAHCLKVKSVENRAAESTTTPPTSSVPSFICPNCGAHFANRSTGTKHQKRCLPTAVATDSEVSPAEDSATHSDDVSNCQDCGVVFSSVTALTRHRRKCVPQRKTPPPESLGQDEPIICSSCAGSYTNRTAYMRHRKKCLAAQATKPEQSEAAVEACGPFICTRCGVEFSNHAACERHQRKCLYNQGTPSKTAAPVASTSPYHCGSCNKRFVYKGRFDLHKLTCKETKRVSASELAGDVTVVASVLVPEVNVVITDPVIDSLLDIPEDVPLSMLLPKGRSFKYKKLSKPMKRFVRIPRAVRKNEKNVRQRKSARLCAPVKKTPAKEDKMDLDEKMPELEKQEPIMNMPVVSPSNLSDIPILSPFSDVAVLDEERMEDGFDKVSLKRRKKKEQKVKARRSSKPATPETNILTTINPIPKILSKRRLNSISKKPLANLTKGTKPTKPSKKSVKERIPQVEALTVVPPVTIILPDSNLISPLSMPPLLVVEHFPMEPVNVDDAIKHNVIDILKLQATAREVELETSDLPSLKASPRQVQTLLEVTPTAKCITSNEASPPDSASPTADVSEHIQKSEEVILAIKALNVQESNRISRPVKKRMTRKAQARTERDRKPTRDVTPSTRKKSYEAVVQSDALVVDCPQSTESLSLATPFDDVPSSIEVPDCSKINNVENPSSTLLLASICQDNAVSLKATEEINILSSVQSVPGPALHLETFNEANVTTPNELEIVEIIIKSSNAKKSSLNKRARVAEVRNNKRTNKQKQINKHKSNLSKGLTFQSSSGKISKQKKALSSKNRNTVIELIDITADMSDDEISAPIADSISITPNKNTLPEITSTVEPIPTLPGCVEMEDITSKLIDIPDTSNLSTLPTSLIDISKDTFSDSPMSFEIPANKTFTNSIEQEISDIISFLENPRNETDISTEELQVLEARTEEPLSLSKNYPMETSNLLTDEVSSIAQCHDNVVPPKVAQDSARVNEHQESDETTKLSGDSELAKELAASDISDCLTEVTKPFEITIDELSKSSKLPLHADNVTTNQNTEKLTMLVTLPISKPFGQLLKSVLQRKIEIKPSPDKSVSDLSPTCQQTPKIIQELLVEEDSVPVVKENSLALVHETYIATGEDIPTTEIAPEDLADIQSSVSTTLKVKRATADRGSMHKASVAMKRKRSSGTKRLVSSAERAHSPSTLIVPRERSVRRTRCRFSYEEMYTSDVASEASSLEFVVAQPPSKKIDLSVKPADDPVPKITVIEKIDKPEVVEEKLATMPDPIVEDSSSNCKILPNESTKVVEETVEPKRKRRKNSLDTHYFCDICTKHYYSNYNLVKHKESAGHKLKVANLHAINNPIEDFQATEDENAFNEITKLDQDAKFTKKLDSFVTENVITTSNYLCENFAKDSDLRINQEFGNYESVSNWLDQQFNEQMDTDWIEPDLGYNLDSPETPAILSKPVAAKQPLQHSEDIDSILNSDHMKDLQKAMGATDDEMLMLQRLGIDSDDDWTQMMVADKSAGDQLPQNTSGKQALGEKNQVHVGDRLDQGECLKRYMTSAFSGLLDRAHTIVQEPWQLSNLGINDQTLETIRRLAACRQQAGGKRIVDSDALTLNSKEGPSKSVSYVGNSPAVLEKVTPAEPAKLLPSSKKERHLSAASLAESSHCDYIESPLEMLASQATKIVNRGLAGSALKTSHDSEKDIEITKTKSKILQCVYLKKAKTLSSEDIPAISVQKISDIKGASRRKKVMKKLSNPVRRELVRDKLLKELDRNHQIKEKERCKVTDKVATALQRDWKSDDKAVSKMKEVSLNGNPSDLDVETIATVHNSERLLAEAALRDLNKGRIQKPSNHRFWGNNYWGMHQYKFVKSEKKIQAPTTHDVKPTAEIPAVTDLSKSTKQKNSKAVGFDVTPCVVDLDPQEEAQFDVYDFNDEEGIAPFRESGLRNSVQEPQVTSIRLEKKQSAEKSKKPKKLVIRSNIPKLWSSDDPVDVEIDNVPIIANVKILESDNDLHPEAAAHFDEANDDQPVELMAKSRRGRNNICYTEIFDDVFSDTEDLSYIDFDDKPARKKAAPRKMAPKPLPKAPPKGKKNNILSCVFGKARRNSNITAGSDISDVDREYIAKAKSDDSDEPIEDSPAS